MIILEMLKLLWSNLISFTKYCPVLLIICMTVLLVLLIVYAVACIASFIYEKAPKHVIVDILLIIFIMCIGGSIVITVLVTASQILKLKGLV